MRTLGAAHDVTVETQVPPPGLKALSKLQNMIVKSQCIFELNFGPINQI